MKNWESRLFKAGLYIFYGLLAYMPLHILLSTWVGTSFDILPAAKVFKEVALIAGFLCAAAAAITKPWFRDFLKDRLIWLIAAYAALTLLLAALKPTDQDAEILGVVYNLRFLLFFIYAGLLAGLYDVKKLLHKSLIIALAVGIFVSLFGVIQYAVLPTDALTKVGYSRENGVLPAFFIDDKPDLERIMSTVRDPNSLGSYLIIITSLALSLFFGTRQKDKARVFAGISLLGLLALLLTFSRSAWLGFIFAAVVILFFLKPLKEYLQQYKKALSIIFVSLILVLTLAAITFKDSYFVQNVIFHADQSTVLEDPNELRVRFWQESVANITQNPAGTGPGTAGLASIRNNVQGTELNENYYLQIASEVGILGLLLFLAILVLVARRLFRRRESTIALALLAAFAGLAVTNFLVHIWSNEAVAYTWWGLTGLLLLNSNSNNAKNSGNLLSSVIRKKRRK